MFLDSGISSISSLSLGLVGVSCFDNIIFIFSVSSIMVDSIKVTCDIEYVVYIVHPLDLLLVLLYEHSKAEPLILIIRFLH